MLHEESKAQESGDPTVEMCVLILEVGVVVRAAKGNGGRSDSGAGASCGWRLEEV